MNAEERRQEKEWLRTRPTWRLSEQYDDDRPSAYERRNKRVWDESNGKQGMRIVLSKGVFWSRGWRGCPQCGGDVTSHQPNKMYLVVEGGCMRIGWSCTGQPGKWEN